MKGIVFTEFLDMVADRWSEDLLDDIIDAANLPTSGAYTSVGTYDISELVSLLTQLSSRTDHTVPELLEIYGRHLFGVFGKNFPEFFEEDSDTLHFLETVDEVIHVEVRKLYPDAALPRFSTQRHEPHRLEMIYSSPRCLGPLALGLMHGCASHFGETIQVGTEDLSGGAGTRLRFDVKRVH